MPLKKDRATTGPLNQRYVTKKCIARNFRMEAGGRKKPAPRLSLHAPRFFYASCELYPCVVGLLLLKNSRTKAVRISSKEREVIEMRLTRGLKASLVVMVIPGTLFTASAPGYAWHRHWGWGEGFGFYPYWGGDYPYYGYYPYYSSHYPCSYPSRYHDCYPCHRYYVY